MLISTLLFFLLNGITHFTATSSHNRMKQWIPLVEMNTHGDQDMENITAEDGINKNIANDRMNDINSEDSSIEMSLVRKRRIISQLPTTPEQRTCFTK
ncbi:Hypothetical protein SRAE_0000067800 [Strongyloides ratti]|uniref:Uncharacterized protein n=1 Tax=Strongyloides ratti TaxID=34506 RepID=A0A090L093_STRRB|nr:Hypothetical protein SRAE_0000067800 [Strongyloides ratti]CEF61557.1 Hypothetical protein SRAE_0000067800 [Strongyloides ratti]